MSIYPYNMLIDNQDAITIDHLTGCMGVNDGVWKDPAAGWLLSFANYGFLTTGRRLHGDNQPQGWINTLTKKGTDPEDVATYNPCLTGYWNLVNAWINIVQEASNTCTNAYTAIYDVQLYTLLASTGQWVRINNVGRPAFAIPWYPTNSFISPITGETSYDDYGNSGWTNFYSGNQKMLHNALQTMITVNGADVICCMATCKARVFNPTNAAFDAPPKILVQIGMDNKYNSDTLGSGVLAGATYLPGLGGSASKLLPADGTPVRVTFTTMRVANTYVGNAFNSIWTDDPANIPYLTESEMSANLPVLRLSTPI